MPAMPGARLTMIEAQVLLGAQETFLDCPAQPGRRCQIGQGRFGASIGEVVRDGLRVTQVSARQREKPSLAVWVSGTQAQS